MQELVGKKVDVHASDVVYSGVLVEIGEREVHLQSETGWVVIPLERIVEIKEAGQ